MDREAIIALLKSEELPTSGCTEPGAVALAAAQAAEVLSSCGEIRHIEITVNANIYKNGVAVGIPGTGETGLHLAAAMGAVKKDPAKKLAILSEVTPQELKIARDLLAAGVVEVNVDLDKSELWIRAELKTDSDASEVVIAGHHTRIISIRRNNEVLFALQAEETEESQDVRAFLQDKSFGIADIVTAIESLPLNDLDFLAIGLDMNLRAADAGIAKSLGMGIGALYHKMIVAGKMSDDAVNYAKTLTAAAVDARMSGANVHVMSIAGSGNLGISAALPVYAVAQKTGASREQMLRAVAISQVITVYIKIRTGNLSALCGSAVAAATGAAAGIAWLSGGSMADIEAAMKNLIANLTGMICDGAKLGCSLKLSTAAGAAVESAFLAGQKIVVPDTNGIIGDTIELTIENLGKISNPGMSFADKVVMEVLQEKHKKREVM